MSSGIFARRSARNDTRSLHKTQEVLLVCECGKLRYRVPCVSIQLTLTSKLQVPCVSIQLTPFSNCTGRPVMRTTGMGADRCSMAGMGVGAGSLKSQSVSYFTVPPRAHPSTGSQSGSATPGRTQETLENPHRCVSPPSGATAAWQCFVR